LSISSSSITGMADNFLLSEKNVDAKAKTQTATKTPTTI
jgi:hypothetical protein